MKRTKRTRRDETVGNVMRFLEKRNKPRGEEMKGYEWSDLWNAMVAHPENWQPTTAAMYDEMLGVLPPQAMKHNAFLVGEPKTHNAEGFLVYACFRKVGGRYEAKYLTEKEFYKI